MTTEKKINQFLKKEKWLKAIEFPFQRFNLLVIGSTIVWGTYLSYSTHNKGIANSITEFLNKYWVKPILSPIGTGDIPIFPLILLAVLLILFFIGKGMRRYVYSRKTITIYAVVIFNYFLLRINDTPYRFSYFTEDGWMKGVAYWDLILLLLIPICFRFIKWSFSFIKMQNLIKRGLVLIAPICDKIKRIYKRFFKKENTNTKDSYLILERELTDKADDTLNRANIAKQIALILEPIKSEKSFAVGITAPWGNGKTSFLNFLILELKERDDKTIFIKFSPWYCKSKIDIISLFFDSLSDGLKPYHSSINNQIEKYAKLLLAVHKNQVSETINKAFDLFSSPNDIRSIYEQINASIGDLNRKIYITIDDLDRLYAKEIIECFKIIRNTADFKNVIFIVAYDPSYVDNALAQGLKNNHKGYIDKIIQLPFSLPRIEEFKLLGYIVTELENRELNSDDILKHSYYKNTELKLIDSHENHDLEVSKYFTNIRNCNKILNIFFTYQKLLGDEVIQSDLFLMCMLKTLYPEEALKIYLNLDDYFSFGEKIQFKDTVKWEDKKRAEREKSSRTIPPVYLIDKLSEEIHLNEREKFINLIQAIFLVTETNLRSVARHNNFETYYNGVVSEEKIKYADFEKWIVSAEILINKIKELDDDGSGTNNQKLGNLHEKLSNFTPQDKDKAQIILHGLLYLDRKLDAVIPMLINFKDDYIEILNRILDHKLEIPLKGIARKLADIKFGIIDAYEDSLYTLNFNKEDLEKLSILILKTKIETGKVDTDLLDIYWSCVSDREKDTNALKIDEKANKLMKKFAEKNAIEFIKILELKRPSRRAENIRSFHYSIDQIFSDKIGNYDGFDKFFKNVVMKDPNNSELQQIWEYWVKYKDSNYKYYELVS